MKKKSVPLVILHGWGLSKKKFDPLQQELEQRGYTVYSLDFPGFGEASQPEKVYTLTDYAHWFYEWLQKSRIHQPILIGHSFGGRVSLRFNTLYPNIVSGLLLTGTPGYRPVKPGKFFLFVLLGKIGKAILSIPLLSRFHDQIRNKYYYIIGAREYTRAQGVMKDTFKNIVTDQLIEDMKKVAVPTHLIWGADDLIVPVSIAERMKQTMLHSTLTVVPNADHGLPFRKPKEFADIVETYV